MSARRILLSYRLTFAALIIVAGGQTIAREGTQPHHALVLATIEIAGAAALAWRPSQLLGASLLLLVFAAAQVVSAATGDWSTRFLLAGDRPHGCRPASTLIHCVLGSPHR